MEINQTDDDQQHEGHASLSFSLKASFAHPTDLRELNIGIDNNFKDSYVLGCRVGKATHAHVPPRRKFMRILQNYIAATKRLIERRSVIFL